MKRLLMLLLLGSTAIAFGQVPRDQARCAAEAKHRLGDVFHVVKFGQLIGDSSLECVVILPYSGAAGQELRARSGVVIAWDGKQWRELLRFNDQIRNEHGYIGADYIDPEYHYGFTLRTDARRSDGTQGFTMYFRFLNAKLRPEGMPMQVSWNSKVNRFQEYAPNELDPPDFKPELRHPPNRRQNN